MNSDKKGLIALLACLAFYLLYTEYLKSKYPEMNNKNEEQTAQTAASDTGDQPVNSETTPLSTSGQTSTGSGDHSLNNSGEAAKLTAPTYVSLSSEELTIENETSIYKFDQNTGGMTSIILKSHKKESAKSPEPMDIAGDGFFLQSAVSQAGKRGFRGYNALRSGNTIKFWRMVGPWELSQTITIPQAGYGAELSFGWKNTSQNQIDLNAVVLMRETIKLQTQAGGFMPGMPSGRPTLISSTSEETDRTDLTEYCDEEELAPALSAANTDLEFFGFDRHYFLKVLLPENKKVGYSIIKDGVSSKTSCPVAAIAWQPQGLIAPNQTVDLKYKAWFGPKTMSEMKAYASNLDSSLDLGWFGFIAQPLFIATKSAYSFTGNWGVAIILITLLLKLIFFPLNKKAAVSMKRMQKLQPEMNKIKEKFKDDKAKQQQEIMKFMSTNKLNPMKGCLPILPQIPVFFAFYRVLSTSIELRHAPFYGWIQDLSSADPFYVTPILLGIAMFFQQKLTPTANMDKTQAKMMMMLPLVFTVMMLSLPAGMVLYMLVNTIVSVGQQQWLNRRLA